MIAGCSPTPCPATSRWRPRRMDLVERGWKRLVSEIGVQFDEPRALELFRAAGQDVEGDLVQVRSGVRARAGGEGALGVQRARAQSRARRPHRRQSHDVPARAGAAVRAHRRRAARRHAGRSRQLHQAGADGARARHAGRQHLRARRRAARFAPPRSDARPDRALGQDLQGLADVADGERGHDPHGRDPVRRARGDRATAR